MRNMRAREQTADNIIQALGLVALQQLHALRKRVSESLSTRKMVILEEGVP